MPDLTFDETGFPSHFDANVYQADGGGRLAVDLYAYEPYRGVTRWNTNYAGFIIDTEDIPQGFASPDHWDGEWYSELSIPVWLLTKIREEWSNND